MANLNDGFRRFLTALTLGSYLVAGEENTCDVNAIQFTTTDALGPFYVEDSEMSSVIAPRQLLIDPADVFTVHGKVLGSDCVPLAQARVEAWYAGEGITGTGDYLDDAFRGQVLTDNCGDFQFTQTFPAVYPQRPVPHIHYMVSSPDNEVLLVTQLYFEGVLVPGVGSPDVTKVSKIVNQEDGSRSAEFNVYVSIPGNADLDACSKASEESENTLFPNTLPPLNTTMPPPSHNGTILMMPNQEDVVADGSTMEIEAEESESEDGDVGTGTSVAKTFSSELFD